MPTSKPRRLAQRASSPFHVPLALWVLLDLVEAAVRTGRPRRGSRPCHRHGRRLRIAAISPRLALLAAGSQAIVAPDEPQRSRAGRGSGRDPRRGPGSARPGQDAASLRRTAATRPGHEGIAAASGCCPRDLRTPRRQTMGEPARPASSAQPGKPKPAPISQHPTRSRRKIHWIALLAAPA